MELNKRFVAICSILLLITISVFAVTQKIFVDTNYNLHNLLNISNVSIFGQFTDSILTIKGGRITSAKSIAVTNATGNYLNFTEMYEGASRVATMDDIVALNVSDTAVRASILTNITNANVSVKVLDDDVRASILTNITNLNSSVSVLDDNVRASILTNATLLNASMTTRDDSTNASQTAFTNERDALFNTTAFIESLGFNITTNLKTYFDTLYQAAGTYVTAVTGTSPIVSSGGTTPAISWAPVDIGLGWRNLTDYPSQCPSNTYVQKINDTVTCAGVSDVYAFNTGDNLSGIYNVSGNFTFPTNRTIKFGDEETGLIYYNGSALVIKVS